MRLNSTFVTLNNSIINQKETNKSLNKLSSGFKINKASDDASGLAIADKLRTQATGIKQSIDNANSAIALLQIADKSMDEISNILDIIKAKLIQAHTRTTSPDGRKAIKKDIEKLLEQIENISNQINYNETPLLKHSGLDFQIGEKNKDIISLNDIDISLYNLSVDKDEIEYEEAYTRNDFSMAVGEEYTLNDIIDNNQELKNIKSADIITNEIYHLSSLRPLDLSVRINQEKIGYSSFNEGFYIPKDESTRQFFREYVEFVKNKSPFHSHQVSILNSTELGEYYKIVLGGNNR